MAKQAGTAKTGIKPKGKGSPHTAIEDRQAIVERICELYESQNSTIASCCEACGITDRVFYLWLAQNSEFSDLYKKAKKKQLDFYWEEVLVPLAPRSFVRLLMGETKTETKSEGENKPDDEGNISFVVKRETITKSEILPNAAVTIFAMKGVYPEKFSPEDAPKSITVTFTDDAKHGFDEPGEPETE